MTGTGQRATPPVAAAIWRPPMLATLTPQRFSSDAWLYERKLDGVRAMVTRDHGTPALWSRNHKSMDAGYPELVDALAGFGPDRFVADGEIVAFEGRQTSFAKLQGRIHLTRATDIERAGVTVYLYLFDLLVLGDTDLTPFPLRDRKRLLRKAFNYIDPIRFSTHRNTDGESFYRHACEHGWEGLIAKRADSAYRSGRSPDWLKFKCVTGQELVIGGFTEPGGSRIGFGALLLGYYDDGRLRYAGKVGTGYDHRTLTSLRAQLDDLEIGAPAFDERVAEPGARWVRPELVAQVDFAEWTRDGRLRHPRFAGLRTDKAATEVVREAE
ncbi:MAG TPA: non-homologous end-joining DNA ligase [Pseudonocardiaceae bacterium]|jgi:DNA ligase D-like protein (predicted ligase)|nr:non-homologous end-joining DNA ligase [Pseudonocardiaceae bacterium]